MAVPRQRKMTSLRGRRSRGVERDKKEWSTSKLVELALFPNGQGKRADSGGESTLFEQSI